LKQSKVLFRIEQ